MNTDPWRRELLNEQFAAPVREYVPTVTEHRAAEQRRGLLVDLHGEENHEMPLQDHKPDLVVDDSGEGGPVLAEVIPIRRACPVCHARVGVGPASAPYVVPHGSPQQPSWCSGSLEWPAAR